MQQFEDEGFIELQSHCKLVSWKILDCLLMPAVDFGNDSEPRFDLRSLLRGGDVRSGKGRSAIRYYAR